MHRLTSFGTAALTAVAFLMALPGCGGAKKPPADATEPSSDTKPGEGDTSKGSGEASSSDGKKDDGKGGGGASEEKKDECTGFDIANIEDALLKSACEEPNVKPDTLAPVDLKNKLEVKLSASPTKSSPGGKVDLLVTFVNKSKDPLVLHFKLDPVARFEIETTDKKGKRADMPGGNPPPPPKGATQPPASEAKAARLTLAPNGSARARLPWEAVKMKWAPEKYRGTPPERGFPRAPAGPLPKGKYTIKVVTPLVGVSDSAMASPTIEIEIG